MNKTITINISGIVFHIDDVAYEKLNSYLKQIKSYFSKLEGSNDIISDIEARIAEIFQSKIGKGKEVVSMEDVNEVISILGQPEDFMDENEIKSEGKESTDYKTNRKLYRDPDDRILGGVCGGIGAYFSIEPIWLRIAFIIALFAGFGFLFYILLWIIIPKATTTLQKLEMRGERVNVSNIEKSIREELNEVKDKFHSRFGSNQRHNKIVNFIGNLIRYFVRSIFVIIGFAFIIAGITIIFTLIWGNIFTGINGFHSFNFPSILGMFFNSSDVSIAFISLSILIIIPILIIIYTGLKLIFRFKFNNKIVALTAFVVWFISLLVFISVVLQTRKDFYSKESFKTEIVLQPINSDTIYLDINKTGFPLFNKEEYDEECPIDFEEIFNEENNSIIIGRPDLNVETSDSNNIVLIIEKKARGRNIEDAEDNSDNITYSFQQKDSLLIFDPFFGLKNDKKWRNQKVKLTLKVPKNKVVYYNKDVNELIEEMNHDRYFIKRRHHHSHDDIDF